MKIYISGKITDNDHAGSDFYKAECELLKQFPDAKIINPYLVGNELPELSHSEYMKVCLALLDICDMVYFLKSWEDSRGANQEMGYALAKDMRISFE